MLGAPEGHRRKCGARFLRPPLRGEADLGAWTGGCVRWRGLAPRLISCGAPPAQKQAHPRQDCEFAAPNPTARPSSTASASSPPTTPAPSPAPPPSPSINSPAGSIPSSPGHPPHLAPPPLPRPPRRPHHPLRRPHHPLLRPARRRRTNPHLDHRHHRAAAQPTLEPAVEDRVMKVTPVG